MSRPQRSCTRIWPRKAPLLLFLISFPLSSLFRLFSFKFPLIVLFSFIFMSLSAKRLHSLRFHFLFPLLVSSFALRVDLWTHSLSISLVRAPKQQSVSKCVHRDRSRRLLSPRGKCSSRADSQEILLGWPNCLLGTCLLFLS